MRYSPEQHAWIRERYASMTNAELAAAASREFGREVTTKAMRAYGKNHNLRKEDGVRGRAVSASKPSPWTPERDAWLASFVPGHSEREITDGFERLFGVRLTRAQLRDRMTHLGVRQGVNKSRFRPGQPAANKGVPWDEWMPAESRERCRATQFHSGNRPHNWRPVGTERLTKDGYVEVKVREEPSGRKAHDNWVPKARLVWEREHGAVPDGMIVVFLDGDRTNFDPQNLGLETRAQHAVIQRSRSPYCDAGSHEVAKAIADLRSAASRARKGGRRG